MGLQISKGKGIDTIVSGYSPGKVEEGKEIMHSGGKYQAFITDFVDYLTHGDPWFGPKKHSISEFSITPEEINELLPYLAKFEGHQNYLRSIGKFIDELMTLACEGGHTNFVLNTKGFIPIDSLGAFVYFSIKHDKPLNFEFTGDVGSYCGVYANNSEYIIHGNVGNYCFGYAKRSAMSITTGQ